MNDLFTDPPAIVHENIDLKAVAAEVNGLVVEARDLGMRSAQTYARIGARLLKVKEKLGHGNWLPWLAENIRFSSRQAQKYMALAAITTIDGDEVIEERWHIISTSDDKLLQPQVDGGTRDENTPNTNSSSHLSQDNGQSQSGQGDRSKSGSRKQGSPYPYERRCRRCRLSNANKAHCQACKDRNADFETLGPRGHKKGEIYCDACRDGRPRQDCDNCLFARHEYRRAHLNFAPFDGLIQKLMELPVNMGSAMGQPGSPEEIGLRRIAAEVQEAYTAWKTSFKKGLRDERKRG
jgi:hypothetical protein